MVWSADSPPTTRTRPSGSAVAAWNARASASDPARLNDIVVGSQTSAEAKWSTAVRPPMISTRPSGRAVAVCQKRSSRSDPAGPNVSVAGSQTSACGAPVSASRAPPTTRTRPSGRAVAVWRNRPSGIDPAGSNDPVVGSQISPTRGRLPCPVSRRRRARARPAVRWRCARHEPPPSTRRVRTTRSSGPTPQPTQGRPAGRRRGPDRRR